MSCARRDLSYYEQFAVQISPKDSDGDFPPGIEQRLRSSLPNFGIVRSFQTLCIRNRTIYGGRPNTAIVVFTSQVAVTKILDSSRRDKPGSLWQTNSIMAHPLDKTGPVSEQFSAQIVPKLNSSSRVRDDHAPQESSSSSDAQVPPDPVQTQTASSKPKLVPPPGAQPTKSEILDKTSGGVATTSCHATPPKPLQTAGLTPGSPEWMRARIAHLESRLDTAKAARDMALSDRSVIQQAFQVEKAARREATMRKSAAEAELSRNRVAHAQLCAELEAASAREAALSKDNSALKELLELADREAKQVQSSMEESGNSAEQIKALKQQLEESRDRLNKFQSHFARLKANSIELDDTKKKLEESNAEVEQLKADLAFSKEQLEAAKVLLESTEQKHSSVHSMYEATSEKLAKYKEWMENEDTAAHKLKGAVTPEVHRSLGVIHEALGGYLSALKPPPVSEEITVRVKQEKD